MLDVILHLLCKQAAEGGSLHNKIMLTSSVSASIHRHPCPGGTPAGKGLRAVAGPSPALCQPRTGQRNRGPNFPNSSTPVPLRISVRR